MAPTTCSSVSNDLAPSNHSTSTNDDKVDIISTGTNDSIDDSAVLATVLDSIKAVQCAIDAITLCLTNHSTAIDTTVKNITTLEHDVRSIHHSVHELPSIFDKKLASIHQDVEMNWM